MIPKPLGVAVVLAAALSVPAGPSPAMKQSIAHRGASSYAPEHTIAAYELAIAQGADYVEQDLAVTRDGVLVCIHDLTLERTTDVEQVFPGRGVEPAAGADKRRQWPVNDFTLAEIKQLDAGSWFGANFAGAQIPTFQEAIDLVRGKAGLYPELKDPVFYRNRHVDQEHLFVEVVKKNRLSADSKTPLIVQSFDAATLRRLATLLPVAPRVYLVGAPGAALLDSPAEIREIATWASGIGPNKEVLTRVPDLVTWAHDRGLTVTPWTFRAGDTGRFASVGDEMAHYLYSLGVDALFTDNPDLFPRR